MQHSETLCFSDIESVPGALHHHFNAVANGESLAFIGVRQFNGIDLQVKGEDFKRSDAPKAHMGLRQRVWCHGANVTMVGGLHSLDGAFIPQMNKFLVEFHAFCFLEKD